MTRTALCLFLLLAISICAPNFVLASNTIRVTAGAKFLEGKEWDQNDQQPELGVECVFGKAQLYLAGSRSDHPGVMFNEEAELIGSTFEVGAGLNQTWTKGRMNAYLAGGLMVSRVELKIVTAGGREFSDVGVNPGGWLELGAFRRLGRHIDLGGQVKGNLTGSDDEGMAPSTGSAAHVALTLGYGW